MEFEISKRKVKEYWEEHKFEIVVGTIIGCLGAICLHQRGILKEFKQIVGDKYDTMMYLAKDVDNSIGYVSFDNNMEAITVDQLINEGMPKLLSETHLTKDDMIQDCVIFVKK